MAKIVTGSYGRRGYAVFCGDKEVYTAGNHPLDSAEILDPDDPSALSLREIRKFCIQTAKEIAKERGASYGGVEREEEEED